MGINNHSLEHVGMVDVDGGQIQFRHYIPHNQGCSERTPLVVTHGGPGGSSIGMYDFLNELADLRPVIFYDQLGSQCSPAELSPELMTVERFAREPYHLLEALSVKKAILLGHSWGGSVMTGFALDHPEYNAKPTAQQTATPTGEPMRSSQNFMSADQRILRRQRKKRKND